MRLRDARSRRLARSSWRTSGRNPIRTTSLSSQGPPRASSRRLELHDHAATVESLGGAHVALGRMSDLPHRVLVTDELEGFATAGAPLVYVATFCRPARIDRRAPCLGVYDWKLPFLKR